MLHMQQTEANVQQQEEMELCFLGHELISQCFASSFYKIASSLSRWHGDKKDGERKWKKIEIMTESQITLQAEEARQLFSADFKYLISFSF